MSKIVHQERSVARLAAVQALYQREAAGAGVDAVVREFLDHRFGGEPRDRAILMAGPAHRAWPWRRRFKPTMSRQARAAKPPLSPSLTRARAQAWSSSSTVSTP